MEVGEGKGVVGAVGGGEATLDGRKVSTYTQLRVELDRPIQLLNRLADRRTLGQYVDLCV